MFLSYVHSSLSWLLYGSHPLLSLLVSSNASWLLPCIVMYKIAASHWKIYGTSIQHVVTQSSSLGRFLGWSLFCLFVPCVCFLCETLFPITFPTSDLSLMVDGLWIPYVVITPLLGQCCMTGLLFGRLYAVCGFIPATTIVTVATALLMFSADEESESEAGANTNTNTAPIETCATLLFCIAYRITGSLAATIALNIGWNAYQQLPIYWIRPTSDMLSDPIAYEARVAGITSIESYIRVIQTHIRIAYHRYIRAPYNHKQYLVPAMNIDTSTSDGERIVHSMAATWPISFITLNDDGQLHPDIISQAKKLFQQLDQHGKGYLTPQEWGQLCMEQCMNLVLLKSVEYSILSPVISSQSNPSTNQHSSPSIDELISQYQKLAYTNPKQYQQIQQQVQPFCEAWRRHYICGSYRGYFGSGVCDESAFLSYIHQHTLSMNLYQQNMTQEILPRAWMERAEKKPLQQP